MGCFFGCFRVKDSNANLVTPSQKPAAPRSKNALSSLFLTADAPLPKEGQNQLPGEVDVRELKDEANILKSCETLPDTPVKIQKALEKWEGISAPKEAEKSTKSNAWLQNASMDKSKLESQSDESPIPVKICEEWVTGSSSFLGSPSSCMTVANNTDSATSSSIQRSVQNVNTPMVMYDSEASSGISSVTTHAYANSIQGKTNLVRFDSEPDMSAHSSKGPSFEQYGSAGTGSVTKPLPYPAKNPSQRNELKDENSDEHNLMSPLVSDPREETTNEGSLSSWLKPLSAKQDGNNKRFNEGVYRRKVPADRPILGMVAAHWTDDDTSSHIPPKWWDGNGIPNSTNKYKEDQKVSWHATPFEERLEKALSEETLISQRKPISALDLNETEESDTALSHLRSSAQPKSVVSF